MKPRILVVAHEATLRSTLARWLAAAGYAVELAEGPKRAREVVARVGVSLAIIAPDRRDAADLELARELANTASGLIVVAERPDEIERLSRLALGAAGFVSKPLDEQEVLAHIETVLHPLRAGGEQAPLELLHFEGCTLDIAGHTFLDASGKEVPLTRGEFALLRAFVGNLGRVLSRDQLRHAVAGRGAEPYDRSVDVLIARLRRKIEPDPKHPRLIITVPGDGYKFAARPRTISAEAAFAPPSTVDPGGQRASTAMAAMALDIALASGRRVDPPRRSIVKAAALLCVVVGAILAWGINRPVQPDESKRSSAAHTSELVSRADQLWWNLRGSTAVVVEVRDLLERAISLDENNVEANARLGAVLTASVNNGWSSDRSTDLSIADTALKRALQIDPAHYSALLSRCEWLRAKSLFEEALRVCQEAHARYPNSVWALKEIGYDKVYLGLAEEALDSFTEANRLEPNSPERWAWLQGAGFACLMLGRNEEAVGWLRRAVDEPLGSGRAYAWLAAAYALLGRGQESREALREFRRLWPAVTITSPYFRRPESPRAINQMQRVIEGLRMAGLPE